MPAATTPVCDFGWKAPDFTLPGVDGKPRSLAELRGEKGLLVAFICNHCPFVVAVIDRLVRDARELAAMGIPTVGICSNDVVNYPADSFENMKLFAQKYEFGFPYLHDESQEVARAYGAVCTPDLFGFDADLGLQYRGRIDATRMEPAAPNVRRDLFEAMTQVARTGAGPKEQIPSMGCSIKWRPAA